MDVTGPQGVPYFKLTPSSNIHVLILTWRIYVDVIVTGFQGVTYFKVALNSHVLKSYVNFTLFFHRVYKK